MSTMRGAIFAGGGAVIDAIDFLKEHFKDIQSDVSEMSKAITQSFESVDTSKAWKAAGEVFNSFVHDIWGGIKPLLESVYQFKDQAIEVFSFIGTAVGGAITVLGEYWGGLYKVAAGIIDVLHTVYVFLDKLGVIGMVVDDFRFLGTVLEGIGIGLNSIYEQTLKPIFEAIGWVYAQIKELLGIKSMALKVKYEGPYAPKDMGFGSYGKDEAMFDAAGKEIGTGESKADPIAEGMKGVAGAAGNQVRNVTVNMDSLVKGVTIVYDQLKHNPKRVLADFEDALMTITRDAEIALG